MVSWIFNVSFIRVSNADGWVIIIIMLFNEPILYPVPSHPVANGEAFVMQN